MARHDVRNRFDQNLSRLRAAPAEAARMGADRFSLGKDDAALRRVFDQSGLDPGDPRSWAILLRAMARARYPARPEVRWNSASWSQLLLDFLRACQREPDSVLAVCRKLIERRARWSTLSPETLRRNLDQAVNPERNLLLKHALASLPTPVLRHMPGHRRGGVVDVDSLPDRWDEALKRNS
jgi:hypothetical protein